MGRVLPAPLLAPPDPLAALHDALTAAEREGALGARLTALLAGAQRLGLGAATIFGHDGPTAAALAHVPAPGDGATRPPLTPSRAVWRRWLRILARRHADFGAGPVHVLPMRDPWVRAEFGETLFGGRHAHLAGVLVATLSDGRGSVLATLAAELPDEVAPTDPVVRVVELMARYGARYIAEDRLAALAERRAERLQRLHEAGAALSRSLDEREIVRELARQAGRLVAADGVVVAHPDVEAGVVRTALRIVRGLARPRAVQPLGDGPIAAVARTGEAVHVDDYDAERNPLAAADDVVGDAGPAGSVLAVPMRVGTQLLGVVAVHAAAMRAFSAEDEELLRTFAAQAGTALANARLFAESEAERRQSEALAEVARAVGASLRLGEVLRLILRHTLALLRAEGACVALRRDDYLHVVAGVGTVELLAGVHMPAAESMMGRALCEGRATISNAVADDPASYRPLQRVAPMRKAVLAPLYAGDEPIGVLAAVDRGADFEEADARVLQRLADHVGVAVANARLFEEVAAATREWKVAFDATAGGMAVLDEQGRVARCNARAAELLGAPGPKALLGAPFVATLAGDAAVAPACASCRGPCAASCHAAPAGDVVGGAIERGETARATVRAVRHGRVYDVVAAPHPDGGAVVTFDDVTGHHALAERHRLVVETVRDAVVLTDAEGRVTFANPAAHELLGRGAELIGEAETALVRPEDVDEVRRRAALARTGEPQRYEAVVCRPDGERRLVSISTAPLRGMGNVDGVVASLRDVTDERRLAGQLVQREKLAAVGRLVSGVAHELNNPLAGVLALAELLAGESADDETRELARGLHAEARRAARVAGRLLAFAGQRAPQRTQADLNRVLLDALDLRRYALRAQDVEVDVALDYELPETWADPHQLQQVFLNLITNAEHALAGVSLGRRLELWTRRDGARLVVAVRDNGPGMSVDDLARVFDPLHAATPGAATTGLGLSISEGIVRDHGGRLRVDTRPGAGATFWVELPLAEPPDGEAPAGLVGVEPAR